MRRHETLDPTAGESARQADREPGAARPVMDPTDPRSDAKWRRGEHIEPSDELEGPRRLRDDRPAA
jgi:hypothetical protein